jgi:hypothetical protein
LQGAHRATHSHFLISSHHRKRDAIALDLTIEKNFNIKKSQKNNKEKKGNDDISLILKRISKSNF